MLLQSVAMREPVGLALRFALPLGGMGLLFFVLGVTPLLDPAFGTTWPVMVVVMFLLPAIPLYAVHRRNEAKGPDESD